MVNLAKQILILFKLRIGVAMMVTTGMGVAATPGPAPSFWAMVLLLSAVLLAAGAAGGLNHYHDFDIDARMERTKNRPFVTGKLVHSPLWLVLFAFLLVVPVLAVWRTINPMAAAFVFLGAFFYGVVYTVWLKRRTWLNIVIGGLAGSFAVLAGTAAVDPTLNPLALSLAFILFLWTPPHFWSLAIALKDEYQVAGVPMLPVVAGQARAARVVLANITLLVLASILPLFFGLGWLYLLGAMVGGGFFLYRGIQLVRTPVVMAAMGSFRASLVQLGLLVLCASLDGLFVS
ncbi:MAG: protoheme IX farnesyltransferase [Magnetococcales bacterium]|nr:protoheme IX farnesyltransferase [Magnetococcales bacterium]MBF0583001.1 protoheme IX farnesyltransferase [Magnetococcales bacterium]